MNPSNKHDDDEPPKETWIQVIEFIITIASVTIFPAIYYIFLLKPAARIYGSHSVATTTIAVALTMLGLSLLYMKRKQKEALPHRPYFYLFLIYFTALPMSLLFAGYILGWMAATPH